MSYEGYKELLCENGHYNALDESYFIYGSDDPRIQTEMEQCPCCGAKYKWQCSVDQTNGYYEDDPQTFEGPKRQIGFDDEWHIDHYGNKYATKIGRYEPVGDRYQLINHD